MFGRFFKSKKPVSQRSYDEQFKELEELNIKPHYDPRERLKKLERRQELVESRRVGKKKVFIMMVGLVAITYGFYLVARYGDSTRPALGTPLYQFSELVDIHYSWTNLSDNKESLSTSLVLKNDRDEVKVSENTTFEVLFYDSANQVVFQQKFSPKEFVISEGNPLILISEPMPERVREMVTKIELVSENSLGSDYEKK